MSFDTLGQRMKRYEEVTKLRLVPHTPIIVRLDGKCFHTFTKPFPRPFSQELSNTFQWSTKQVYKHAVKYLFAYGQSDEVSFLIYNPSTFTQEHFDGEVAKLNSIIASVFTAHFNATMNVYAQFIEGLSKLAYFDCRVFNLPEEEVLNYFIWRQQDAMRNSISMVAQSNFSHKELHGKNNNEMQDMLMTKGVNWNDTLTQFKRGWAIRSQVSLEVDKEMPILTQDKDYLLNVIKMEKEKNESN